MTTFAGVLSDAVPYLVTTGAAGLGYLGGLRPGREARQQTRAEALYQAVLEDLDKDQHDAFRRVGMFSFKDAPVYTWPESKAVEVRLVLFANRSVNKAWQRAKQPLSLLRMLADTKDGDVSAEDISELTLQGLDAREHLIVEMRHDLRVERMGLGPIGRRIRRRRQDKLKPWQPTG